MRFLVLRSLGTVLAPSSLPFAVARLAKIMEGYYLAFLRLHGFAIFTTFLFSHQ